MFIDSCPKVVILKKSAKSRHPIFKFPVYSMNEVKSEKLYRFLQILKSPAK